MKYSGVKEGKSVLMNSPRALKNSRVYERGRRQGTLSVTVLVTVYGLSQQKSRGHRSAPDLPLGCSGDTHCVGLGLLPRRSPPRHHRLHHSHPALFVWETGSHKVNTLSRPAGGVTTGLQLQDVGNIWHTGGGGGGGDRGKDLKMLLLKR